MGEALLVRKGGGGSKDVVNGIIEEYYAATEDINANTFVEFANASQVSDFTSFSNSIGSFSSARFKAIKLSDNKICVANVENGSSFYMRIVEINDDGTLTVGTMLTVLCSAYTIFMDRLSDDKFFVAMNYSNGNGTMYVFSVSGTVITQLSYQGRTTNEGSITDISSIDENRILATRYYSSNLHIDLWVLSGTTLTKSLTTSFSHMNNTLLHIHALSSNKALLLFSDAQSITASIYQRFLKAAVISVSSAAITVGTATTAPYQMSGFAKSNKISSDTIFIFDTLQNTSETSTAATIIGSVIKIENNDVIHMGSPTVLGNGPVRVQSSKLLTADNNNGILIPVTGGENAVGAFIPVKIQGITCVSGERFILSNNNSCGICCFSFGSVFIGVQAANLIYSIKCSSLLKIKEANSVIQGLTKSKATTTKKGKVQILNR